MKITTGTSLVNSNDHLLVCFDVSKHTLNLFSRHDEGGRTLSLEDVVANQTRAIEHVLTRCHEFARERGKNGLIVLCEATGGYERKLLDTAHRLGHRTALINPEHVAKFKTIESNDTGKTDHKDPRVMHLVARMGKTQKHRHLPEIYRRLRRLTAYYDDDQEVLTAIRLRIQSLVGELFPDYDKSATFTFGNTGSALMDAFQYNPYRIVKAGYGRFQKAMKRRVRWVRFATLEHLYACAEASRSYHRSDDEVELIVSRLIALWSDFERLTKRRALLQQQIEALGEELLEAGALPRLDHLPGITVFNLARIAGETGPLGDFHSKRALVRYAGLNIRERKSGTYRGQDRISKKGRPLLRKILGQATFPLLRRQHLYGPYYHRKLYEGMLAQKAKVAVMRRFLELLFALSKNQNAFEPDRFTRCESQYDAFRLAA